MSVTVRARLPKGDANGLASWEAALADNPDMVLPIVALVRADTIEAHPHDDDDSRKVKLVFLGIEAPANGDRDVVDKMVRAAYGERTGKLALPFEDED
jgi:hypothetical protein